MRAMWQHKRDVHSCTTRAPLCRAKAQDKVWTAQDLYYFPTQDQEVYKPEQVTVEGALLGPRLVGNWKGGPSGVSCSGAWRTLFVVTRGTQRQSQYGAELLHV